MKSNLSCVITTIQTPTASLSRLGSRLREIGAELVVVGDEKGPAQFGFEGAHFLSLQAQLQSRFDLARKLPVAHYARKNVGYLTAIKNGSSSIYETDDDNAPLDHWQPRGEVVSANPIGQGGWVNVFRWFTRERIWPRGFPLDEIAGAADRTPEPSASVSVRAPIQQGLVNKSPDVDAIWRLVLERPFDFLPALSVRVNPGAWCPFNSQSTWWFPIAYPLMYLPSYCSFRMTDIWRSFIAQRCLWELDLGVVFHAPEVVQERNLHDLMRDFAGEIPGYTRNKQMVSVLEGLKLSRGPDAVGENVLACYGALVAQDFFSRDELELVGVWLRDLEGVKG